MEISSKDFFQFTADLAACGDQMGKGRHRGVLLLQALTDAGFTVTRDPKDRKELPKPVPGATDDDPNSLFETTSTG